MPALSLILRTNIVWIDIAILEACQPVAAMIHCGDAKSAAKYIWGLFSDCGEKLPAHRVRACMHETEQTVKKTNMEGKYSIGLLLTPRSLDCNVDLFQSVVLRCWGQAQATVAPRRFDGWAQAVAIYPREVVEQSTRSKRQRRAPRPDSRSKRRHR